ncbi:MAG: cyclic lactone autoinducer peptide [Acutalibacter sp.]|jgi:cyclic lactone autoinducer peptide
MTSLFAFLASIIEMIASAGAGVASIGCGYEPELPEELRK